MQDEITGLVSLVSNYHSEMRLVKNTNLGVNVSKYNAMGSKASEVNK
jgi:hypothetical protein